MKHIFLCIFFCCLIIIVVYSAENKSDSIPPFEIGNKWLFNVNENNNGTTVNYLMTKEIVDTINSTKFIINTKKYKENSVIDSVEYWTWHDSAFSISEYINSNGTVIFKIGQQNYWLSNGLHIYIYTNIVDTILSIISEGSIYSHFFHINLYSSEWATKFALKIGLYEASSYSSGDGNYSSTQVELIGVRINNVVLGDTTYLITDVEEKPELLKEFSLVQNYPNPFNPSTNIRYSISSRLFVTLKVYDVLGKEVATLVNEDKRAGSYEVEFNASYLPSGVYFYQLNAGDFIQTRKMILVK